MNKQEFIQELVGVRNEEYAHQFLEQNREELPFLSQRDVTSINKMLDTSRWFIDVDVKGMKICKRDTELNPACKRDEEGCWVHVLTSLRYRRITEQAVRDVVCSVMRVEDEICVSNYQQGNWYTWSNGSVALEMDGRISNGFMNDCHSRLTRVGLRVASDENVGNPRFEGWLRPSESKLTALVCRQGWKRNLDHRLQVYKAAKALGVGYKSTHQGDKGGQHG